MNNKNMEKSYGIYLAYFFMALIALNALRALFRGEYNAMVTAVLMLGMTVIPFVVAKRMNINLPWFVFFLVALALWIHTAGYVQGYYTTFYPYYDKIAHIVSGTAVAVLGFLGVIFVDKYMKMNLNTWFIIFFTIIFGMAMGAAWEIYEFLVDFFFGGSLAGPMQNSLNDTMLDMMFVLAGSIVVALLGVFWFKQHRKEEITQGARIPV
ncbi:MAG TPA: hypothetical protein PLV88_00985 [Methanoregulaceae archaeon]|jgi:hypothetical protein|nr:hypothetical protein [Methanoregulaceae archaeon]HNI41181.1 hypothetical protein [Methanoregulaceae archaeon]HNJ79937.1 hypothetical protein [Methanoregulaceae archaeon]HNL85627.1 hypothetical protein [Methanoregulaceae archaeon]HQN89296.1 hypothetical protein [Methanoregulaceae archaeon]